MENASKALIIAGAILLSISIIAIGMAVFNQAKEAMDGSSLSSEKVATYNSKFDSYAGSQSGSNVKALLTTIQNHNLANVNDESLQVKITTVTGATSGDVTDSIDAAKAKTVIKSGYQYKVEFKPDEQSGYINAVTITKQTTNNNKLN